MERTIATEYPDSSAYDHVIEVMQKLVDTLPKEIRALTYVRLASDCTSVRAVDLVESGLMDGSVVYDLVLR